jgi:hypothetical protein
MSRPRFLADHDLNEHIIDGVRRREPALEFIRARDVGLSDKLDSEVLAFAADNGFLLISHDVNTMPAQAFARVAAADGQVADAFVGGVVEGVGGGHNDAGERVLGDPIGADGIPMCVMHVGAFSAPAAEKAGRGTSHSACRFASSGGEPRWHACPPGFERTRWRLSWKD